MEKKGVWKRIRVKTLVIIALTIIGLFIVIQAISAEISNDSFSKLEKKGVGDDLDAISQTLLKDQENLRSRVIDWGNWNETYQFAADGNSSYVDQNLGMGTMDLLGLDTMIFLNYSGSILHAETNPPDNETGLDLQGDILAHLRSDGYLMVRVRASEQTMGVIALPGHPMLICARPILTSDGDGPVHGLVLFGKWLDKSEETFLSETVTHEVKFYFVNDPALTSRIGNANAQNLNLSGEVIVPLNSSTIAGYFTILDIYGNIAFVIEVLEDRDVFAIGQSGQSFLLISLIISGIIFALVTMILLETLVISRISRLSGQVGEIASSGNTERRVKNSGRDEIGELSININGMLEALDQSQRGLIEAEHINRDKLEHLVDERTNELKESNRALVAEVEERQRTEERLRESESRYRAIIEDQMELIHRSRPDGIITFVNQAYARYYSEDPEALLGTRFRPQLPEGDWNIICRQLERISISNPVVSYQHRVVMTDGMERWQNWTSRGIFDHSGNLLEVQSVGQDVTEKVKLEQELFKIQKLESVGRMAGRIAHDFNNILTSIIGNITLAKMEQGPSSNTSKRLSEAESSILRAKILTHQLLTFSEGGDPVKVRTDLSELAQSSIELALKGTKVRSEVNLEADLWPVEVDRGQLQQAICNVTQNSIDAMPEGGGIEVRGYNWQNKGESGLPLPVGNYVVLSLKDRGPGILEENLPRIFDPFFTTRTDKSGLGLTAALSIIRKHDGYMDMKSEDGAGTTCKMYIPALPADRSEDKVRLTRTRTKAARVLLMDDEVMILTVMAELIRMLGYEVETATNGQEAIDTYAKERERGKGFDLVIMDLTIPGGMGGKEAIRRMLETYPDARAIVSSGYSNDPVMSEHRAHGFVGVLQKPYTANELEQALRTALIPD